MTTSFLKRNAGFTLVEMIIGMTLSLMIMGAILSSYVFLGRNFTRSLGIGSATDPNLESQGRRTLAYFAQDVRMASGLTDVLKNTEATLVLPTATGTRKVTYYFNNTTDPTPVYGFTVQPNTLTRIDRNAGTAITLHTNLLQSPTSPSPRIDYYDISGNPYTSATLLSGNYLSGIKQIALSFNCQVGKIEKGTLSQTYQVTSPRLILRNKPLLP